MSLLSGVMTGGGSGDLIIDPVPALRRYKDGYNRWVDDDEGPRNGALRLVRGHIGTTDVTLTVGGVALTVKHRSITRLLSERSIDFMLDDRHMDRVSIVDDAAKRIEDWAKS